MNRDCQLDKVVNVEFHDVFMRLLKCNSEIGNAEVLFEVLDS